MEGQIIFTEDFTTPGAWILNTAIGPEGSDPNYFVIDDYEGGVPPPACGVTSNGNNTLHITSVMNPTGGAIYDVGGQCGVLSCPLTNRMAISPVFSCVQYSPVLVNFDYMEGGQGLADNATIWYNEGPGWVFLQDLPKTTVCANQKGQWTHRIVSIPTLLGVNPQVKIAFMWVNNDDGVGTNPSFAVDNIVISVIPPAPLNITPSSYALCTCLADSVIFQSNIALNTGNVFTVQLSDANGSFTSPTNIGSLNTTANSGSIPVTYPCNLPNGTGYKLKVVSSSPVAESNPTGNLSINQTVTPSIQISATSGGNFCLGTTPIFYASILNGGGVPSYQWQVNGVNANSNLTLNTFTSNSLATGDVVTCILTSNATCATSPIVVSNPITVNFLPPPTVTITVTPATTICVGTPLTLSGGGASTYAWTNGAVDGVPFTPGFTTIYTVTATASNNCTATATQLITVAGNLNVNATAFPNTTICFGDSVTLSAIGGSSYSWSGGVTNGVPFTPVNSSTYTVTATTIPGCTGTSTVSVMVLPILTPSINLSSSPNPIVTGQIAYFTANVGGASSYHINWYKEHVLTSTTWSSTNTFYTYITSLTDSVYAELVPSGCYNPDSVISAAVYPEYPQGVMESPKKKFQIFPNPNHGMILITQAEAIHKIKISNAIGQTIYLNTFTNEAQIDIVLNCTPGIYYLEIIGNEENEIQELIIE